MLLMKNYTVIVNEFMSLFFTSSSLEPSMTLREHAGLEIMDCRGYGFGIAAVIKCQHYGVQRRILEVNAKAEFIACSNDSLNVAEIKLLIYATIYTSLFFKSALNWVLLI